MPTSQAPAEVNEPNQPAAQAEGSAGESSITGSILGLNTFPKLSLEAAGEPEPRDAELQAPEPLNLTPQDREPGEAASPAACGSRWVDYNTHELLEMIGELEDERRWARLREGALWAVLVHIVLLSCLTWIPRYVFKTPRIIDPFDAIQQRHDLTYLDELPDAVRKLEKPRVVPKPPANKPLIDKQTMEQMKRDAQPPPPPPAEQQAPEQPQQQATQPIPNIPQSQAPEAPHPQEVPKKAFAMGSQNPADQLRQDMQSAMRGHGQQSYGDQGSGGLAMHPGAGTGGIDILSDTQGVDFSSWIARWHYITQHTWDPLIPDEVNPPISKQGVVVVHFKVLPNGQVVDMQLDGRSGDSGLDRAAWGAISGSSYPALPHEFHGPYLELRAYFLYNVEPQ
jgi:TonB family protein